MLAGLAAGACAAFAWQQAFRVYPSLEPYDNVPVPRDWGEHTEWVFGRLMYPEHPNAMFGRRSRWGGEQNWREGEPVGRRTTRGRTGILRRLSGD